MKKTIFAAMLVGASLLSACGGGGSASLSDSGGGTGSSGSSGVATLLTPVGGGASSGVAYTQADGVGLWEYANPDTTAAREVQVSITGTQAGSTAAMLMLTNTTNQPLSLQGFSPVSVTSVMPALQRASKQMVTDAQSVRDLQRAETTKKVADLLTLKASSQPSEARAMAAVLKAEVLPPSPVLGDARTWQDCQQVDGNYACAYVAPTIASTLVAQRTVQMTSGEEAWTVNVWVADAERGDGKVTDAMAQALADAYASENGVFKLTRRIGGGNPWGAHAFPDVISGSTRQLDLVVSNLTPDQQPLGLVGFFSTINVLKPSFSSASNGALALFLDSETAYLHQDGLKLLKGTVAHEATHLRNFYNRQLKNTMGAYYDLWLDEMTAMAFEELYAGTELQGFSPAASSRVPYFLSYASGNCSLREFNSAGGQCFGYAVGGSFGAYMLRNYGHQFLSSIWGSGNIYSDRVFKDAMESLMRPQFQAQDYCALPADYGQRSYEGKVAAGDELYACKEKFVAKATRSWHQATLGGFSDARVAQALSAASPLHIGYPARSYARDSAGLQYSLPAIDMQYLTSRYRPEIDAPATLAPGGSYAWPVYPNSSLEQTVPVPAGAVLSVMVD